MNQELLIINKQAAELAEKSLLLSEKLKSLAIESTHQEVSTSHPFIFQLTVFCLACFVGYYVVWKVTPALHTPLMSITNAISGIIIVGALITSAGQIVDLSMILGIIAVFLAGVNIFGGFIVTERMLEMFKKK